VRCDPSIPLHLRPCAPRRAVHDPDEAVLAASWPAPALVAHLETQQPLPTTPPRGRIATLQRICPSDNDEERRPPWICRELEQLAVQRHGPRPIPLTTPRQREHIQGLQPSVRSLSVFFIITVPVPIDPVFCVLGALRERAAPGAFGPPAAHFVLLCDDVVTKVSSQMPALRLSQARNSVSDLAFSSSLYSPDILYLHGARA
jgi:hypothetical protein